MKIGDKVRVKSNYVEKKLIADYMAVKKKVGKIIEIDEDYYLPILVDFKSFSWWCSKNWISSMKEGLELE